DSNAFWQDVSDLLKLRYKVLTEADYLKDNGDGTWTQVEHGEQHKAVVDSLRSALELKVVGVIRPKEGANGSISGVYGYTEALTELLIETAKNHPAVKEILRRVAEDQASEHPNGSITSPITFKAYGSNVSKKAGDTIVWYDENAEGNINKSYTDFLRALGIVTLEDPTNIEFYCSSFEAKDKIIAFIDQYNAEQHAEAQANGTKAEEIKYSDMLATMMSFVNTMANTITGVLVAFAAISLVVSTIMIAIIIYTSVLERRKEIGVLRSIGARKKDISRVFLAESAILGGYSGIIGVLVSYLISLLGAFVLKVVFSIDGLMEVKWWHCVMMLGISILLSMLAGFIPSRIAAKKDPAIALRSE
ncbi:MAG: ABC transporter permease, partial [Clostridia bacterium]|nr:ABC transporter permease [Clostridia bacterium]